MDEDEHSRAEQEMKLLHLRHVHHRKETQKFVSRLTSLLYKALLLTVGFGLLCLSLSHFTEFTRYSRPAVLARSWDAISILLVSFVIAFGFLGRGQPDDEEIDRSENVFNVNSFFESNGSLGDPAPKSIGLNDSAFESNGCEDFPQISDGFEAVSDFGYENPRIPEVNHADSRFSTVSAEVIEVLENKQSLCIFDGSRRAPPPQQPPVSIIPPPPQPPVSIILPPTLPPVSFIHLPQNDSNMAPPMMRYCSLKRKRRIISPSLPHPPPTASPALETLYPQERSKDASGHEKSEKPPKMDKTKSENKNPSNLPPRCSPHPTADRITVNHESRHRRSRNKEYSQHRTNKEDEHKHRRSKDEHKYNSAEDIANALGILDRKHTKIPSSPSPQLQQWWSSYKKESKHKSKDPEPLPRPHSDKSSRNNVHSSSSSNPSLRPPLPRTSVVDTISKHHRKMHSSGIPAPGPPPPTFIVERISKHHRNREISESNGLSKSRRDETSESKVSSNSSKENMAGDGKAEENLDSWKSSPISLPPSPPPPPFLLPNDTKREKRRRSTAESAKSEFEPELESERSRAFAFRKQFPLDNANPQFCPSPSPDEVNKKADAFIAGFYEQIRLQNVKKA